MRQLTHAKFDSFLAEKPLAVIHFDADWNGYRLDVRRRMLDAEQAYGDAASFAEVDADAQVDLGRSIPIVNVPTVAYFRDGRLVAALIGANQNVKARVCRMLNGEAIGYGDGTSDPPSPPSPRASWYRRLFRWL